MSRKKSFNIWPFSKVEKIEDDSWDSEKIDVEEEGLQEEERIEEEERLKVLERAGKSREETPVNTRDARKQKVEERFRKEKREESLHKEKEEADEDKRRRVLINVVMDGSYSMVLIYAKIYYMLQNLVERIQVECKEYKAVVVQFGLTILHEKAEPYKFKNQKYFTESAEEFLEALTRFSFQGGGADGKEPLNATLLQALDIVNRNMGENTSAGILFFTDSIPEDDEMEPEFDEEGLEGILNKGLRFAYIYSYQKEYQPVLRMVDLNGQVVENGKNDAFYLDIEKDIIKENISTLSANIEQTVSAILRQLSMLVG